MPVALRPLFVWHIRFRRGTGHVEDDLAELEQRLHTYRARVEVDAGRVFVRMRVVGFEGAASAVG